MPDYYAKELKGAEEVYEIYDENGKFMTVTCNKKAAEEKVAVINRGNAKNPPRAIKMKVVKTK